MPAAASTLARKETEQLQRRLTPKNLDVRVVPHFLSRLHLASRTVEAKSEKPRPQNDVVKADIQCHVFHTTEKSSVLGSYNCRIRRGIAP
jgi:hypothetical protein